jgi:hypothetical protein
MNKSKTMTVTINVQDCLKVLRDTVNTLKKGKEKELAEKAITYLEETASGKTQPYRGQHCNAVRVVRK